MTQPKYVYFFGPGESEGDTTMRALLGGKGANLAEMTNLGVPVPQVSRFPLKFANTTTITITSTLPVLTNRLPRTFRN